MIYRHFALTPVSTGGTTELPVSLADVKAACRLSSTGTDEDSFLSGKILTAARVIEGASNRAMLRKQYDFVLDRAPGCGYIKLPVAPLVSVDSIVGIDTDGAETTLSTAAYTADTASEPGRVLLNSGYAWPSGLRDYAALRVRFTAGYSTQASGIPDPLRTAVEQFVAHLYEHRGDGSMEFPPVVERLLADFLLPEAS